MAGRLIAALAGLVQPSSHFAWGNKSINRATGCTKFSLIEVIDVFCLNLPICLLLTRARGNMAGALVIANMAMLSFILLEGVEIASPNCGLLLDAIARHEQS